MKSTQHGKYERLCIKMCDFMFMIIIIDSLIVILVYLEHVTVNVKEYVICGIFMMVKIYIAVFWLIDHIVLTNNQKMEAEHSSKHW